MVSGKIFWVKKFRAISFGRMDWNEFFAILTFGKLYFSAEFSFWDNFFSECYSFFPLCDAIKILKSQFPTLCMFSQIVLQIFLTMSVKYTQNLSGIYLQSFNNLLTNSWYLLWSSPNFLEISNKFLMLQYLFVIILLRFFKFLCKKISSITFLKFF